MAISDYFTETRVRLALRNSTVNKGNGMSYSENCKVYMKIAWKPALNMSRINKYFFLYYCDA